METEIPTPWKQRDHSYELEEIRNCFILIIIIFIIIIIIIIIIVVVVITIVIFLISLYYESAKRLQTRIRLLFLWEKSSAIHY